MAYAVGDQVLTDVGLPVAEVERWTTLWPTFGGELDRDAQAGSRFWLAGEFLLKRLPPVPERSDQQRRVAEMLKDDLRSVRLSFLRLHASTLYAKLTDNLRQFVRVEDLVYAAAERIPGLVPSREQVLHERERLQKDKEGCEMDQGVFLSQVLSDRLSGAHLVHAMLRPLPESLDRLEEFQQTGRLEIEHTTVERRGSTGYVWHGNPRFLNAEDDATTHSLEIAADLVLLDPTIDVCVIRGKTVEHPKYAGRRLFNAGINLTHLYHGRISLVDFFIARDMGVVNKIYRGLSADEFWVHEVETNVEKPWIAAVEGFAIGGGCQLLLVMDYVLAERSSFFNLPARKEGIIPGAANMRLWRFVGDRLARQAILFERSFAADSAEGQLMCDQVVPDGDMDPALEATIDGLARSGVVSAAGNRKAMRVGQEPLDRFRQYMAVYCREQAICHYSPQLIRNLEENWRAHERQP